MNTAKRIAKLHDLDRVYRMAGQSVPDFSKWTSGDIRHVHRSLGLSTLTNRKRNAKEKR